jgi:hypothetical protein
MGTVKNTMMLLAFMALTSLGMAQPQVYVNAWYLNYGDVPYGITDTTYFTINNLGNEPLEVSDIFFSNDDFITDLTSLTVQPGTWVNMDVYFTPTTLGFYNETLTVASNDPDTPVSETAITANAILPAPEYLVGNVQQNNVELSWGTSGPQGSWMVYDNGHYNASFGLQQAGTMRIAARWPAASLTEFVGQGINKIAFFPTGQNTLHTLKIWSGEQAGTLLYSQALINLDYMNWNEAHLEIPLAIQAGQDYWIGLELTQLNDFDASAAIDIGPAVAGLGDMINLGGDWFSATGAGFDYNWMIRTFVGIGDRNLLLAGQPETALTTEMLELKMGENNLNRNPAERNLRSTQILGYNLYRDNELLNSEPVLDAFYVDNNLDNGIYEYGVTAVYAEGESDAITKTLQVGAPQLLIEPAFISDTLMSGQVLELSLLLTNAGSSLLEWDVEDLPDWISLSQTAGSITPDSTASILFTVNTNGMFNSPNETLLAFSTNNANTPVVNIPVYIAIIGQSEAAFDVDFLDFGMVPVLESKTMELTLTNLTDALLMFLSFSTEQEYFAAFPSTWALQPGESMPITAFFSPPAAGSFIDTLYVEHFGYLGGGVIKLPLSGQGGVMPPANLTAILDQTTVNLNWLPPGSSPDQLRFGNGEPYSSIGTTAGVYEFAARFTPVDLMPYNGKQLEAVGFYPHDNNAAFALKIYTGPDANTELVNLPLNNIQPGEWNDITLTAPIDLSQVDFLWLSYEITLDELAYIAGVDGGPGVVGSGDLLRADGNMWMTLGDYGWSYNWNIRGLVADPQSAARNTQWLQNTASADRQTSTLIGYHVYRDSIKLTNDPIPELSFTDQIEEGFTYLYGVTAVTSFGESSPATVEVSAPGTLSMPDGWNFNPTAMAHNIHIPVDLLQIGMNLQIGDMLGAFYMDNGVAKAAGAGLWDGEHLVVTIYGNDPSTPQKDGFDENETIHWKLYMHNTGSTANLVPDYSPLMPHHDGTFRMLGLSMIEMLEMDVVGIGETSLSQLQIYPNPSKGNFRIDGLQQGDLLRIFEASGRLILQEEAGRGTNYFQLSTKGFYLIEMQRQNQLVREKLIIN